MRKDYIPTSVSQACDETEFIRQYWEEIWRQQRGRKRDDNQIVRREEYRIIAPYLKLLPKNARLLDGGCGLGKWAVFFSEKGYSVVGMDLARGTIEKLQALFPDIDFLVGDIRNTGLESRSFDCMFSWGVFEHFEEGMQLCIREASRLLRPGGYLFVSVPYDNFRHALKSIHDRNVADFKDKDVRFYQWRFTRKELIMELKLGGFDVLGVKQIGKRQGIFRCLHHEFALDYDWFATKALSFLLRPFIPAWLVAHMILGVAQKPHP